MNESKITKDQKSSGKQSKKTNLIVENQYQTSSDAPTFKELFEKYFDEIYIQK